LKDLITGHAVDLFIPFLAARSSTPHRGQKSVDNRRAGGQEQLPDRGVECPMAVLLQGVNRGGKDRFTPLTANAILRLRRMASVSRTASSLVRRETICELTTAAPAAASSGIACLRWQLATATNSSRTPNLLRPGGLM
jgi:hypothetical protein